MKKLLILFGLSIFCNIVSAQNVGIGTTSPTNTLHIVPSPNSDPLRIEGVNIFSGETFFLVIDTNTGIIKHMPMDSLIALSGDSIDTDIDSVIYNNDTLYVYENNKQFKVYINSSSIDSSYIDSIILANYDTTYSLIADSLLNDTTWLNQLKDSIDSDVDSVILVSDTSLYLYEDGKIIVANISAIKDSSEWIDGNRIGLIPGAIYARKALQRGDTIIIDNGKLGINVSNPVSNIDNLGQIWIRKGAGGGPLPSNAGAGVKIESNPGQNYSLIQSYDYTNSLSHDLILNSSGGNIGLGTTVPSHKLDVNGQARIRTINDTNNINGLLTHRADGVIQNIPYDTLLNNIQDSSEWIDGIKVGLIPNAIYARKALLQGDTVTVNNGDFGIGVLSPGTKLDVDGDISVGRFETYTSASPFFPNTYGNRLYFNGVSHNSDPVWISKFNKGPDSTYLRFNAGDNTNITDAFQFIQSNDVFMHIQTNGNVGVGTVTPLNTMHLSKATGDTRLRIDADPLNTNESWNPGITMYQDGGAIASFIGLTGDSDFGLTGTVYPLMFGNNLLFSIDNPSNPNSTFTNIYFSIDDTVKMTIKANGNVGIGTINPSDKLTVFNGTTTGTYTSTGWVHSSDLRLKTNITPITEALNIINNMEGVYYNWKKNKKGERQVGFIAQDVKKILPEVVVGKEGDIEKGETLSMAYQNIVPVLVEAIKEQQKIIDAKTEEFNRYKKEMELQNKKMRHEIDEIKKLLKQ